MKQHAFVYIPALHLVTLPFPAVYVSLRVSALTQGHCGPLWAHLCEPVKGNGASDAHKTRTQGAK